MDCARALKLLLEAKRKAPTAAVVARLERVIRSLTWDDFVRARVALPVESSLLGEVVHFASTREEAREVRAGGGVPYTAEELRYLLSEVPSDEELLRLHLAKKLFDGEIVVPEPLSPPRPPDLGPREGSAKARMALGRLVGRVAACTRCPLHRTRTRVVPGEGHPLARVFLVGEAPGRWEDVTGRPFVGKAGKVLDGLLASVGLSRRAVYVTNVVKCRPSDGGKDRKPLDAEVEACRPFLKQQLFLVRPDVVVALGATALSWFAPEERISRVRGKAFSAYGFLVYPVYHPAAVLHRPELRADLERDFSALPRLLEG